MDPRLRKLPLTKEDVSALLASQSEKVSSELEHGSHTWSRSPGSPAHDDRRVKGGRYPLMEEDTKSCLPAESSTLSSDQHEAFHEGNKPLCSELCEDMFFQETEGFLSCSSHKTPLKTRVWNQQDICEVKAVSSRVTNEGFQYFFQLPKIDSMRNITVETSKDGWLFITSNTNSSKIKGDRIRKPEETKDIAACDEMINLKPCTSTECVLQEAAEARKRLQQPLSQPQQQRQKSCTQSTGDSDPLAFSSTIALPAEADLTSAKCKYDAVECVLEVFFPKTTPKYLNLCCS